MFHGFLVPFRWGRMNGTSRSLYSLIWDFLLSQINIWTTTTWSNVWFVLPKPFWYEFLIGFFIWTPASKYLHLTTFSNICVIFRGINNDHIVGIIRDYLNNLPPKVDVLCLQEHKLRGANVDRNIRMLWSRDKLWALEAGPSNEVDDMRLGVGRGRIAIYIHLRLQALIYDQVSLPLVKGIRFKG